MAKTGVYCLVLALCAAACSRAEDSTSRQQVVLKQEADPPDRNVDPLPPPPSTHGSPSLAEQLREVHEGADSARSAREKTLSAERLLSLYEATGTEDSPHLLAVRQDLAARAAQLLMEEAPDRAKESAQLGLNLSQTPSVLRANLFLALADAEEALGNRAQAKRALLEALVINEELFRSEMETP